MERIVSILSIWTFVTSILLPFRAHIPFFSCSPTTIILLSTISFCVTFPFFPLFSISIYLTCILSLFHTSLLFQYNPFPFFFFCISILALFLQLSSPFLPFLKTVSRKLAHVNPLTCKFVNVLLL